MERWKRILPRILTVLAVMAGGWLLWQGIALYRADCVVRVEYTGLEHMWRISDASYYAVNASSAVRVPAFLARLVFGEDVAQREIYDDSDTEYWYAELEYAGDETSFTNEASVKTGFGDRYRLVYRNWTRNTAAPGDKDLELMRRAAETLHSGDPADWSWQGGGGMGLTCFLMIRHGEHCLLVQDDRLLLRAAEDGAFPLLMEIPDGGRFAYACFRAS